MSNPSSGGGGLGGFRLPWSPTGLGGGGGGVPTHGFPGLSGGGPLSGGGGGPVPPTGLAGPAAPATDFSQGFKAGLGAGGTASPLMPPVQPGPAASGGGVPAGEVSSGPAAMPAAGGSAVSGPPPVSGPPAASMAGSAPPSPATGAGSGVPAAPMGPLPPFGSDVPRSPISSAAASVSPASGGVAPASPSGGGGSSAGPVAPLPPGVVGSGLGATTGAASEGIRSSLPDPLLESASQLVNQLLIDSREYPYMDWCVGMFQTGTGVEAVIVNSDGAGCIPAGVFVPRSSRALFSVPGLSTAFVARWFSWANPAETMLAFAEEISAKNPNTVLLALAVSTDNGGSSVPARNAGLDLYEDCPRKPAPVVEDAPRSRLDDRHMHRLETLDRALYARLIGYGDGRLPDPSEAWRTTVAAVGTVLERAGALRDFAVPPVIREVMDLMGKGQPVPEDRWGILQAGYVNASLNNAALRPGRLPGDVGASAHSLAYHDLTRVIELLLLWHEDSLKYPEIAYLAALIRMTPQPWRAG